MKVSVVITTFNEEQDIAECLDSLLEQTRPADEIVLVDDGSTDRTLEIVRNYPVRVIKSEHKGRCYVRNLGWRKAEGDFILYAEADSTFNKEWIEEILKTFQSGADAVIDQRRYYYQDTFLQKCLNANFDIRFAEYKPFSAWAFRRHVLETTGGYNEHLDQSEERELGKRLAEEGFTIKLAEKAFQYHKGEPNTLSELINRAFSSERRRVLGYLQMYPNEKAYMKLFVLLFFIVSLVLSIEFPTLFYYILPCYAGVFISLLLSIAFIERGYKVMSLPALIGLTFFRVLRALFVALGAIAGEFKRIFYPYLAFQNVHSQFIESRISLPIDQLQVSVVVPAYNDEALIGDCVKSLINQSWKPLEVIVVDDGSKDGTAEAAEQAGAMVIRAPHNLGRSGARNLGWRSSSGNVVVFGDSDTFFSSNWIEHCVKKLVHHDAVAERRAVHDPHTFYLECLQANYVLNYHKYQPFCAWVMRREVLETLGGFDETINQAEERDLGTRIFKHGFSIGFAEEAVQFHAGRPRTLWQGLKRTFIQSKDRLEYFRKYPANFSLAKYSLYLLLLFSVLAAAAARQFQIALASAILIPLVLFVFVFVKQAIIKRGWILIKKRHLFGLVSIRVTENITEVLGLLYGQLRKVI